MKKIKLLANLALVSTLAGSIGVITSCSCNKQEETTRVKTLTVNTYCKLDYRVGEKFDLTGLSLIATYYDGTTKEVWGGYYSSISQGYEFKESDLSDSLKVQIIFEGKLLILDAKVKPGATGITLSQTTMFIESDLEAKNSQPISAKINYDVPSDENIITWSIEQGDDIIFLSKTTSTSDEKITVSAFDDAVGNAKIKATYGTFSAICLIKVSAGDISIVDNDGVARVADETTIFSYSGENIKSKDGKIDIPRDSFNQPILIGNRTSYISKNFLCGCSSFNQEIVIPEGVTTIHCGFLFGCKSFNKQLNLPSTLVNLNVLQSGLGALVFMSGCDAFNNGDPKGTSTKPFVIPNSVKTIGDNFLIGCKSFNQKITLPTNDDFTTIPAYFLENCTAFNNGDPKGTSTKPFVIPNSVKTISKSFLRGCTSFDQKITLPTNDDFTTIQDSFLYGCTSFNQEITIPQSITSIGNDFLHDCDSFNNGDSEGASNNPLNIPDGVETIGDGFLAAGITGPGKIVEKNYASSFNQKIVIPNSVKSIGDYFLGSKTFVDSHKFSQELTIPNGVITIGKNFMYSCDLFDKQIIIPNTVTTIKTGFLGCCFAFQNTIDFSALNPNNITIEGSTMLEDVDTHNTITFKVAAGTKLDWESKLKTATGKTAEGAWPATWVIQEV